MPIFEKLDYDPFAEPTESSIFERIDYDPFEDQPEGALGALESGLKSTGGLLKSAYDVVAGNDEAVVQTTIEPQQKTSEQEEFAQQLSQYGKPENVWEAVKNVAKAAWEKPEGATHEVLAQLPNSGAVMGSSGAGAGIGFLLGGPVGSVVGGLVGMYVGNTAVETGAAAQDLASKGEYDRGLALAGGAVKGGVITGVDAATMGLTKFITGAPVRAATKATEKFLLDAGVDVADKAAVKTFLETNKGVAKQIEKTVERAVIQSNKGLKPTGRLAASFAAENLSEGVGEYAGSAAAPGMNADLTDAVLESMMSIPQSTTDVAVGKTLNVIDRNKNQTLDAAKKANAALLGQEIDDTQVDPKNRALELFVEAKRGASQEDIEEVLAESPEIRSHFESLLDMEAKEAEQQQQAVAGQQQDESKAWETDIKKQQAAAQAQRGLLSVSNEAEGFGDVVALREQERLKNQSASTQEAISASQKLMESNQRQMENIETPPNYDLKESGGLLTRNVEEFRRLKKQEQEVEYLKQAQASTVAPSKEQQEKQKRIDQLFKGFGERANRRRQSGDVPVLEAGEVEDSRLVKPKKEDPTWLGTKQNELAERLGGKEKLLGKDYVSPVKKGEYGEKLTERHSADSVIVEDQEVLDTMQSEVNNSESRGSTYDEEGNKVFYGASSPEWMKNLHATAKAKGQKGFTRGEINVLINKVRKGEKPLTEKQQARFDLLQEAAQEVKNTSPGFAQSYEAEEMEGQGFEPMGGQKIPAADLEPGSQFIGTVDGKKDTWNVKGEHNGNIVLQDGVKKEVDMFDSVQVDGIKKSKPKLNTDGEPFTKKEVESTVKVLQDNGINAEPVKVMGGYGYQIRDESTDAGDFINHEIDRRETIGGMLEKNKQRFEENPLDAENNADFLSNYIDRGVERHQVGTKSAPSQPESGKKLTYEEFKDQYTSLFNDGMKYSPGQVGSEYFSEKMADLSDQYPGWADKVEEEAYREHAASGKSQAPSSPATAIGNQEETPIPTQQPKTPEAKVKAKEIKQEVKKVDTAPTDAQKEAGNYKKGHIKIEGFDISVENPDGSTRSGVDNDGNAWESRMHGHYGYFKRTLGNDGDHVDVVVAPGATESPKVFVVDQVVPDTFDFDEHKVMMGVDSKDEAEALYMSNYADGWEGFGGVTEMTPDEFRTWVKDEKQTGKPLYKEQDNNTPAASDVSATPGVTSIQSNKKPEQKQGGTGKAGGVDGVESKKAQSPEIEDFGEKLGGAKKDRIRSTDTEYSDKDLSTLPLSKIWPKKEIDEIEDTFSAAVASVARAEIPRKPNKPYKRKQWVEQVKLLREMPGMLERVGRDKFFEKISKVSSLSNLVSKIKLFEQIDRKHWDRIGSVGEYPKAYRFVDGKQITAPMSYIEIDGKDKRLDVGSISEAMDQINEALTQGDQASSKGMKFEVRGSAASGYFVNKTGDKEYTPLKNFKTTKAAFAYIKSNNADLVAEWEKVKDRHNVKKTDVRNAKNRPRVGSDHRNGEDVTPEQFSNTFGFRGVEFGNWVSQGKNNKERQGMLNLAYDSLIDLASILKIPVKAISLNGKLGLGFGSRGSGIASAHYEPGKVVINLTKTRGAGSLAHEWFHALDNYFQKKRTTQGNGEQFITHQPETYYVHKKTGHTLSESRMERVSGVNMDEWEKVSGVRPEVEKAFVDLVQSLNDSPMAKRSVKTDGPRSKQYWSKMLEMAARAFEKYTIAKMDKAGYHNDYLANVTSETDFTRDNDRYPYLLNSELAPVEKAFDNLFSTIKTKETDTGVALYSTTPTTPGQSITLPQIKKMFKGQSVTINKDGSVSVRLKNGAGVIIRTVKQAAEGKYLFSTEAGKMDQNGVIAGKYVNGQIELVEGVADGKTFTHELEHFLEDANILIKGDIMVMDAKIKHLDNTGKLPFKLKQDPRENRADFLAHYLADRDAFRGTRIGRIIQKVADFLDGMFNLGRSSVRKIARGIESGEVYSRDGNTGKTNNSASFQLTYHGTPHEWQPEPGFPNGRPRLDKISTGEGAAAYGWGWYSAESEDVANLYQKELSTAKRKFFLNGKPFTPKSPSTAEAIKDAYHFTEGTKEDVLDFINGRKKDSSAPHLIDQDVETIGDGVVTIYNGFNYKLDIPDATIPKLLDWDKPLSQQSDSLLEESDLEERWNERWVKKSSDDTKKSDPTGAEIYRTIKKNLGSDKAASEYLASIGIPGNKYLDGNSRSKGKGSYNYVIWDQGVLDKVALLERNGEKIETIKAQHSTTLNTDTKAFKDWFKGSKVVDGKGEPLVLYHGSPDAEGIEAFSKRINGISGWFSSDPKHAGNYTMGGVFKRRGNGAVFPTYLSIQNPIDLSNIDMDSKITISDFLLKAGLPKDQINDVVSFLKRTSSFPENVNSEKIAWQHIQQGGGQIVQKLQKYGYDGILQKEGKNKTLVYAAFNPTQIKSKFNRGTWSQTDPRIHYSTVPENPVSNADTIDKDLADQGRKDIDRIMEKLRKVTPASAIPVSEKKTRKLIADYLQLKQNSRDQTLDLENRIKDFKDFLMTLPMEVRGKAMKGMVRISKAKTIDTREKYFQQARQQSEKFLDQYFTREAKAKLNRLRKQPHMTKGGEIKKSKISPEAQRYLDIINNKILAWEPKPSSKYKIATKLERDKAINALFTDKAELEKEPSLSKAQQNKLDTIEMTIEAMRIFGGITEMSLGEVEAARTKLKEIIDNGRTLWRAAELNRKADLQLIRNRMAQDITGDASPVPETLAQQKRRRDKERGIVSRAVRGLGDFDTVHQSWRYLMDKIFGKGEGRTLETKSGIVASSLVHHATNREEEIATELKNMIQGKVIELSGNKKGRALARWINKQSITKNTYTINPKTTGPEPIELSPFEAAYWWAVHRRGLAMATDDQENFNVRLSDMGVDADFLAQVESKVDKKILDFAVWLSDSFGERVWEIVNPVHEARYGASLTHTENYTPIHANYQQGPTDENLLQRMERGSSLQKGALHELTKTRMAIKPMNILEVWLDHAYDMAHFAAWALPVQQLEGMFSAPETRGFIEHTHGASMNKHITNFLDHFKQGQKKRKELLHWTERLRGRFATAVLGLNPTIFYKQLASIGAMMDRIPVADFAVGMADFFVSPVKKARILNDSTAFKTRKSAGHTRDVIRAKRESLSNSIADVKGLPNQLMFLVKLGDQAAIYAGGWPVYRYYKNLYKKEGMTDKAAHKEAILRFEESFKDTQQSGEIMDLGLIQQAGPMYQLFTMFMTAQTSYYRGVAAGIRNFSKSPMDSLKRIGIFWILMPAVFEAIASAPLALGDDDDDKDLFWQRMGRSVALGPFNGLFVVRDVLNSFYNMAFVKNEAWMSGVGTPLVSAIDKINQLIVEMRKGIEDGEFDMEDVVNDSIDILSLMSGYPIAQGKKLIGNVKEGLEQGNPAKIMGYTDYYTEED